MTILIVNGHAKTIDADAEMPLLWVLREQLKLPGTKYGCGIAQCGACTVHVNGQPVRSCSIPVAALDGAKIDTIEGLRGADGELHAVQKAWIKHQVPQCGYCQSGQIMSAVALLRDSASPTDEQIDSAMRGNICRCGAYGRIRAAIKTAAGAMPDLKEENLEQSTSEDVDNA